MPLHAIDFYVFLLAQVDFFHFVIMSLQIEYLEYSCYE